MDECLDFWNHNLKGIPSKKQESSKKMTWFQCEGVLPPSPTIKMMPGDWHNLEGVQVDKKLDLHLGSSQKLTLSDDQTLVLSITYDPFNGMSCGEMLSFGDPDMPGDQRFFNHPNLTWTMEECVQDKLDIFGFPEFRCQFAIDNDTQGFLTAKLCDVFPNGQSKLMSIGTWNLCHFKSHENPEELKPRQFYSGQFKMDAIGYQVQPGHSLTLTVCSSYWPFILNPRKDTQISLKSAKLTLPLLSNPKSSLIGPDDPQSLFKTPRHGIPMKIEFLKEPSFKRRSEIGLSDKSVVIETIADEGKCYNYDNGVTMGRTMVSRYTLKNTEDPLSGVALIKCDMDIGYKLLDGTNQDAKIVTKSEQTNDDKNIYVDESLRVELNNALIFEKSYNTKIARQMC